MTSHFFEYNKNKVIQALRYHFISRREIKGMMVVVNLFAICTAGLYYYKKISPIAFLLSSMLWFIMMVLFWYLLPIIIYKKSTSFKDRFRVSIHELTFTLEHTQAARSFSWKEFFGWMESPHFFHLYFNSTSFFLIPKEAFKEDDLQEVRNTFREKIKKSG